MAAKKKNPPAPINSEVVYAVKRRRQTTGRGGAGSQPGEKLAQFTGRGAVGSPNTTKPGQPTGRGARTGNAPYKAKWQTTDKNFPGWKITPGPDTTPKGRGKSVPPKQGGRPKSANTGKKK